jgi:hypothetical protein
MPAIFQLLPLFAASDIARQRLTSGRLESFTEWWQAPVTMLVVAAVVAAVIWLYRRDAVELSPRVAILLATLRLGAMACLLAAWLDLQRTTEHELIFPSRVAILIDSSASMSLEDTPADSADASTDEPTGGSRLDRGMEILDSGLLDSLAETHELSLWRFDAEVEPLAVLPTLDETAEEKKTATSGDKAAGEADPAAGSQQPENWRERLVAGGFETRLGEALVRVADREPLDVLSGVIVLSDGAANAGVDSTAAAAAFAEAGVPVLSLGIGSQRLPPNARVADVLAPTRVFPDDRFSVTAYLQQQGLDGRTVRCELVETDASGNGGRVVDVIDTPLATEGELVPVRFDVPGLATAGRRSLVVRISPTGGGQLDGTPADDTQETEIEVVDRVTEVLLMAGGPTRDYQFMRNVLKRDESFAVDVLLATAREGSSQDARAILDAFPTSPEALDAYDVVVAFDYDWRDLGPIEMARLERWVARESGGLVLVSGAVGMPAWLGRPETTPIRRLYPVELRQQASLILDPLDGSQEPMPLAFTPDGRDAEFLWLAESRVLSDALWSRFEGVYGCYDATDPKPGATVYARAGRLGAGALAASSPIFMAGQFYGSGTVFTLGSGELWRLRGIDVDAYDRLTTQLLRHVSQGRLLRGSRKLRLLVERDRYAVGSNVEVRVMTPPRSRPEGDPRCEVTTPEGTQVVIPLEPDPVRDGELRGSFVAAVEGTWRVSAALPGEEGEDARATRRIVARLPDRELKSPRLDRGTLEQLASATGGRSWFPEPLEWNAAMSEELAGLLEDRARHEFQAGATDIDFKQWLNTSLLAAAVGLLCLEWIARRLARLA